MEEKGKCIDNLLAMLIYRQRINIGQHAVEDPKLKLHRSEIYRIISLFNQTHALFGALIRSSPSFCDSEQWDKVQLAHINGLVYFSLGP